MQGIRISEECRRVHSNSPALGTKGAAVEDIGARRFVLELLILFVLVLGTNGAAEAALANFCGTAAARQVAIFVSRVN